MFKVNNKDTRTTIQDRVGENQVLLAGYVLKCLIKKKFNCKFVVF